MTKGDIFGLGVITLILSGIFTIVYLFADNFWRILSSL